MRGRGENGECEISVDRHEELGTRFLRFLPFRGMFFNDHSPQKNATFWLSVIKTRAENNLIRANKHGEIEIINYIGNHKLYRDVLEIVEC